MIPLSTDSRPLSAEGTACSSIHATASPWSPQKLRSCDVHEKTREGVVAVVVVHVTYHHFQLVARVYLARGHKPGANERMLLGDGNGDTHVRRHVQACVVSRYSRENRGIQPDCRLRTSL